MALSKADIDRMILHESATAARIRMVARVEARRADRERTLRIRAARFAKYSPMGRAL